LGKGVFLGKGILLLFHQGMAMGNKVVWGDWIALPLEYWCVLNFENIERRVGLGG